MTHYSSNTIELPSTGELSEGGLSHDSEHPRSSRTLIHLLDDDSLLIIFSLCRPVILDENVVYNYQILEGGEWSRERWWLGLIQVCRRWRYLVLDSAFHLQVSLVCARGTPVADMLAHSPPVPLIIDHIDDSHGLSPEDEEGIILALQRRDRVRRIRILKPIPILQKLIIALDGEFPVLEFLLIWHQRYHRPVIEHIPNLNFPETFRAPHLQQLLLKNFAISIVSPSLANMGSLVTLFLTSIPSSAYFHPNVLLQWLSLMPQLEIFKIELKAYNPSLNVERQLSSTSVMERVTLPNLRWVGFRGTSAYLEALLPWVTIPLLEKLQVYFFNRIDQVYSVPHLREFMSTARNLLPKTATIISNEDCIRVMSYPHKETRYIFDLELGGKHFDWQIVSAAQVFPAFKTVFSGVVDLTFKYKRHNMLPGWNR